MKIANYYYRAPVELLEARVKLMRRLAERIEVLMAKDQRNDGLSVEDNYKLTALRGQFDHLRKGSGV